MVELSRNFNCVTLLLSLFIKKIFWYENELVLVYISCSHAWRTTTESMFTLEDFKGVQQPLKF